jgi:hypothetical protein
LHAVLQIPCTAIDQLTENVADTLGLGLGLIDIVQPLVASTQETTAQLSLQYVKALSNTSLQFEINLPDVSLARGKSWGVESFL